MRHVANPVGRSKNLLVFRDRTLSCGDNTCTIDQLDLALGPYPKFADPKFVNRDLVVL